MYLSRALNELSAGPGGGGSEGSSSNVAFCLNAVWSRRESEVESERNKGGAKICRLFNVQASAARGVDRVGATSGRARGVTDVESGLRGTSVDALNDVRIACNGPAPAIVRNVDRDMCGGEVWDMNARKLR